MSEYQHYVDDIVARFWRYRATRFAGLNCPECPRQRDPLRPLRPPVFCNKHEHYNVIVDGAPNPGEVLAALPPRRRHRWFGSMRSSQALAQSIFGNLRASNKLHLLARVRSDEGLPAFFTVTPAADAFTLDRPMHHLRRSLGEPVATSVDLFINGDRTVAIECKLTEAKIGDCSRVHLPADHPKHCDGRYARHPVWTRRCSLAEKSDVRYWEYVPHLFPRWQADTDHDPCPLSDTYQLIRNVLAACLKHDGRLAPTFGHVVLLYDDRNPAFGSNGMATQAYERARDALLDPVTLRRCFWQQVIGCLAQDPELGWLIEAIEAKYGLTAIGSDRSAA
jgi:restriction endonuclease-like protein